MDSTDVTRQLREVVRPALRDVGFREFTGRNAWRHVDGVIWCVNFQSFSSYLADGIGCTTFSFAVNLGVYYAATDAARPDDQMRPKESACTFRFSGLKSLSQPMFHPYGRREPTDRRDVWYVTEDGSNLMQTVGDARSLILGPGLDELAAYSDPLYAYCALFDYYRTWPPPTVSPHIKATLHPPVASPSWRSTMSLLAPLLGRDAATDETTGLPDALLNEVLGRHPRVTTAPTSKDPTAATSPQGTISSQSRRPPWWHRRRFGD